MNTDKLMELPYEAGLRNAVLRVIDAMRRAVEREQEGKLTFYDPTNWADELAAALRAEQAVGDEQRARELLAECLEELNATAHGPVLEGSLRDRITRALGTARQSEGVVRAPAIRLHDSWRGTADRLDKWSKLPENKKSLLGQTMEEAAHFIRHHLAAAPGGEGEGKV